MKFLDYKDVEGDPVEQERTEIVERKGLGHPDSISDGIAESVSRALCQEYRERFGKVLHHNTDEVQLIAGSSEPEFGGGETVKPIYILLGGRATKQLKGEKIPVDRIARDAAKEYIKDNFRRLDPEHIEFDSRIGETSTDLKSIFSGRTPVSNDTSFGVGHAPFSETEKIVKKLEKVLREEFEELGEDIKIMGSRTEGIIHLTLATASISSKIPDLKAYMDLKEKVEKRAIEEAHKHTDNNIKIDHNTADNPEDKSVYLTVTGTSAEMGDDGSVGRGNRVNGLITPDRAMSLEAASGKNPVTHVGKIYNLLSRKIAVQIFKQTGEFAEVKILSQIGKPTDEPQAVDVKSSAGEKQIKQIVERELDEIQDITDKAIAGELKTF